MRSKRVARHRARHHGRRTRRAAHHRDCLRACASPAPKMANIRHAQRAQQALTAALPRTSVARTLTQTHTLATRFSRCAARSAPPDRPRSRHSHSLNDLRNRRCERGNRATQKTAPLPQTVRLRQWSGEGRSARQAIPFASTRAALLDPYLSVLALKRR